MSIILADRINLEDDPIDVIERVVSTAELPFERYSEEDLSAQFSGRWCAYQLWFAFRSDIQALHFSAGFDMRVPVDRRSAIYPLLALINERLWLGHFDLWSEEGHPAWRHSVLFRGGVMPNETQIGDLIGVGLDECERFYPAFQHVIWGGKSPDDALATALVDTIGEA